MSKVGDDSGSPRAIVHKRILDVAGSRPDASMADIADEISGATPDLVERVLGEYGDPADQQTEEGTQMAQQSPTQDDEPAEQHAEQGTDESATGQETDEPVAEQNNADRPAPEQDSADGDDEPSTGQTATPKPEELQLTTKQRETARLVHETPEASQGDIANRLGVTRATVSRRLNDIPGFEWKNRKSFTEALFDRPAGDGTVNTSDDEQSDDRDRSDTESQSASQPSETRLDDEGGESASSQSDDGVGLPPELAHKVVHAAMESDRVSEDEELQLLKALLD